MFILLTIGLIICSVWLTQMMIDLANNSLPDIMLKCFGILVFLLTLMVLLGKEMFIN